MSIHAIVHMARVRFDWIIKNDCSDYSLINMTTHWFIDYRSWVAAARTPAESAGASDGVKGVKQPRREEQKGAVYGTAFAITGGYYPNLVHVTNEVLAGTKKKTITGHIRGVGILFFQALSSL